ncbi:MAG: hypothetical protein LUG96_01495 [Tannerellaceae bacterium]|nr:hypothetical protein [Tannerellaceae bacterium]
MKIDQTDICQYGLELLPGSLDVVFAYLKRKAMRQNDWAEADGVEPDVLFPEFESKQVTLQFILHTSGQRTFHELYKEVIRLLSAPGYRRMDFGTGKEYALRYSRTGRFSLPRPQYRTLTTAQFSVTFVDDRPVEQIGTASRPSGGVDPGDGLYLNKYAFADFGITMEDGTDRLLHYPDIKDPFTDGGMVDVSTLQTEKKEVTLQLLMVAGSSGEFYNNHAALFQQLAGPGIQTLTVEGIDIPVCYLDCPTCHLEEWSENRIVLSLGIKLLIPLISWVDAGGSLVVSVLLDDIDGILTDEEGTILRLA